MDLSLYIWQSSEVAVMLSFIKAWAEEIRTAIMMNFSTSLLAAALAFPLVALGGCPTPHHDLRVKTTSGTFTGFVDPKFPDVRQWLGVPFGAPPVGNKRFLPAEPAPYSGAHGAKEYKPICLQNGGPGGGIFWELVPEFQNTDEQQEDCLYLNIWAPPKPKREKDDDASKHKTKRLPVIIWVVGGAFQEGGGHAPYQVPDHWIQHTQTHLVVTFNYRVSVWGFPGAKGAPVNGAFTDVRLVVEWLRDNVEGFGGDPERMILWGQSAGGGTVDAYSYANPSDPIVSGLVSQSGVISQINRQNTSAFSAVAEKFGCNDNDGEIELSCMQKVDPIELRTFIRSSASPRFGPSADNVTLFENNTMRAEQGLVAKVPLILGNTINEGAAFAPKTPDYVEGPDEEFLKRWLQRFACPIITEIDIRGKHGLPTYRYLSAGNFSNITPRPWLGAMHSSDIPLVFGTHWQYRGNSTELEWMTSFSMQGFWQSFAADSGSDPVDGSGLVWPEYTSDAENVMVLFGDGVGTQLVSREYYDDVYQCDG